MNTKQAMQKLAKPFTLVRPVGMSDAHATEWLKAAVSVLAPLAAARPEMFVAVCERACGECRYHGELVPYIKEHCRMTWEGADYIPSLTPARQVEQIEQRSDVKALIDRAAGSLRA